MTDRWYWLACRTGAFVFLASALFHWVGADDTAAVASMAMALGMLLVSDRYHPDRCQCDCRARTEGTPSDLRKPSDHE